MLKDTECPVGNCSINTIQIALIKESINLTEVNMRTRIKAWITILGVVAFALTGCSRYSAEPTEG